MLKVFVAYVFLAAHGHVVGALHINGEFPDYVACMDMVDKTKEEYTEAAKANDAIPLTVCIEVNVPQEEVTSL